MQGACLCFRELLEETKRLQRQRDRRAVSSTVLATRVKQHTEQGSGVLTKR